MIPITFGRQLCGSLDQAATREWLVTDGLGGFAMGTVAGLRTRRHHGLLVVATAPPIGRHLGLAALDAVVVVGDRRVPLATHEWASGAVAPAGHELIDRFDLVAGIPRWRWSVGPVVLEAEIAIMPGQSLVGVQWAMMSTGHRERVGLEVEALCTWRDVHGERFADGAPEISKSSNGFTFEGAYRVRGPGFEPTGEWYRGVHHREESDRGLNSNEDLWFAGRFTAELAAGECMGVEAWSGDLNVEPPSAGSIIDAARVRAHAVVAAANASDDVDATLALAADQFVVKAPSGPTVVAGYPWFGDWSRDTMTSYEGLFLETGRVDDGRSLLTTAAESISEGMLANTADAGGTEYNTVDGALWFLHAVGRHVDRTGDVDLGARLVPAMADIIDHHLEGTRFGIRVDDDGLITQGADGWALTWMDARVDGRPITPRTGKPVEVNALWIDGLRATAAIARATGQDPTRFERLWDAAVASFGARFARADGAGLLDVVDASDDRLRPNQLVAAALVPLDVVDVVAIVKAVEPLVTSVGLRSLAPDDEGFIGRHRGGPAARDAAYHQGTVWPWLVGPWVDSLLRTTEHVDPSMLFGLEAHLAEWGLGSVSETTDGDAPHMATGCPFQAWSVAELLRARRLLHAS